MQKLQNTHKRNNTNETQYKQGTTTTHKTQQQKHKQLNTIKQQ